MKLSIITVNYNNKDGLLKTIDSVISQTWHDFEWIIIDGGSTDGSKELIEQYQQLFAYWCSEPDNGVYNAMNKGIAEAKGEYLLFLNSGDTLSNKNVLELLFSKELFGDVVYGDWYMITDDGSSVFVKSPSKVSVSFFYSTNICHQAMFIKTDALKITGYDENYKVYADWARWMQMCLEGSKFQYVPVAICEFDATDGLSRRYCHQHDIEKRLIQEIVPEAIRVDVDEIDTLKKELFQYQQSFLIQDTLSLVNERPLYCKLVHFNLICVKCLKKVLDWLIIR